MMMMMMMMYWVRTSQWARRIPDVTKVTNTQFTRYNRLSNRLYKTELTSGWMFVYTIQPVVQPVVKPD